MSGSVRVMILLLIFCSNSRWLFAQEPEKTRLIDQEPFDTVVVLDQAEEKELKVRPLKLTPRRMPNNPAATDKVRVRLVDDEDNREFELLWRDVVKVRFHEEQVLAEAEALTANLKFDEAYDYYQYLLRDFPKTPRLDASMQAYWYLSAGVAFKQKKYDEALAVLEELLRANPKYQHSEKSPSLMKVLNGIADKLLQNFYDKKDYGSSRTLLFRLLAAYADAKEQPFAEKWTKTLEGDAARKRNEAQAHLQAKRYTAAYDAAGAMLEIWPNVEGGRELAKTISETYPVLSVGVSSAGKYPNAFRFDRWGDRRTGRLVDRRLVESIGLSAEGGEYASPVGTVERSEDGRVLRFQIRSQVSNSITAYDIAALLLAGTKESTLDFSPAWAEVFGDVRIVNPLLVEVALRRSHVIPRALPAFSLRSLDVPADQLSARMGAYELLETPEKLRFVLPVGASAQTGQIREIQEKLYADAPQAILDLERGKIDCLDRLQPIDVKRVQGLAQINVVRYALPVLHVLVPNTQRPWPKLRTFRRAVLYGIQRDSILRYGILQQPVDAAGTPERPYSLPGAQLISAPFPAPLDGNDPNAYAYDSDIKPYAYEPLLSLTLLELAKREAKSIADTKKEKGPTFEKLVIGHPAAEIPRMACRAIAKQLEPLGLPCKLVELDGKTAMPADVDFVYAELTVTEPTVDASRLFGSQGLFPAENPHVRMAVRRVEQATTWSEASQRLHDLHRVMHEELTVLPLYQTPEYCAFGRNVSQTPSSPITFYHQLESWRIAPRGGG
jgi:tetratricopeptide (TPR) repeat protein